MATTQSRLAVWAAAGAAGFGLAAADALGQVSIAWTGAGDGASWSDPNNWNPAVVPDNGASTYNVTLGLTGNVFLDLDIACTIDDLILGANHTLKINPGHSLTVLDDAFLDGAIEVQNASFVAASPGASFGSANRSRLLAQGGGLVRIGATNYSSSGLVGTATLFSAHGLGSTIDLSTLQSISTGFNDGCCAGTNVHSIVAGADGIVDLSGVQTLLGPVNAEDRLDIVLGTDGQILLPNLQEIGSTSAGDVRFVINVPGYTFPSLLSAADFDLLPGAGTAVDLPLLETLARAEIVVPNGASVSMPSVLSITGSSISVAAGGSLSAPAASDFTGNTIAIDAGQALDFPLFETIDNSRFVVQGGSVLEVAATSYSSSGLASTQTIIGAEGAGTLVDWSTVQSIDAGFNDGCCAGTNVHTVSASAGAVIDLSSLQVASGPVNAEDRLDFKVASGGDIVLDALQEVDSTGAGDVRFSIEVPSFALPSLFSASDVDLLPAAGTSLDLPSLVLLDGAEVVVPSGAEVSMPAVVGISNSTISVGTGGTLYAPAAASFIGNVVTFDSGQIMTLPVLGSIDASRFAVTGGSMLVVAATSYSSASLASTQTIVNAHGPGTIVDWSSVQSLSAAFNDGCCAGTNVHSFVAAADSFLDLSAVQSVVGPARAEDRLDFRAADGGMLLLTSLASATGSGPTRFEAAGAGSVLDLSAFGVFDRPSQLKGTSDSTILLGGLGLVGSGSAAFDDDVFGYPSVRLDGSFRNQLQNEANLKTDDLRLTMTAHYGLFEAAGTDLGPVPPSPVTFELGELTFEPGEPEPYGLVDAVVVFVDNFDNGNRPDIDTPEAVYITGHDGFDAIQGLHGGTLVLNGLNVYAYDDGAWTNLQAGLPPLGKVPFKDGSLANRLDETIGDVNGSRCVDGEDLGLLLGAWGGSNPVYDLNGDGTVDGADLGLLLGAWGSCI